MRVALFSFVLLSACTSQDMCRSLPIGASIEGMKRFEVTGASDYVFRAMLAPVSRAPFGRGSGLIWDQGPAEAAMCCSTQESGKPLSWCTAEQLQCTEPSLQGLKLHVLLEPFSDESRAPDDAMYCYVAAQNGRIIAIWHRYWS